MDDPGVLGVMHGALLLSGHHEAVTAGGVLGVRDGRGGALEAAGEAAAAAEEKELAQWAESAGEASSAGTGAPLIEDVVDESTEEEAEADDPPTLEKRHVLQRASSREPVRPCRTE